MKAVMLEAPGNAVLSSIPEPRIAGEDEILLAVRKIGLCGTDLNSYRGRNALVSFPRVPGHEIAATVAELNPNHPEWLPGTAVTVSPYKNCGHCAACRRNRPNACQFNQTLGVQRDGALTEFIAVPAEKLYRADLSLKELCLVEPLTVGFHTTARGRVSSEDCVAVFGCGAWEQSRPLHSKELPSSASILMTPSSPQRRKPAPLTSSTPPAEICTKCSSRLPKAADPTS